MQRIERDEIIIRKAIVHILDCDSGFMKTSNALLDLGPDLNEFLRGHIFRLIDSDDTKQCRFSEDLSPICNMLEELNEKDDDQFIEVSKVLAENLFDIMCESVEIPPADFIVASFQVQSTVHLALLKMNYKDSYIHLQVDEVQNDIIKQHIMPSTGARLTEAVIINLETMDIRLVEKRYEIKEEKINYLSERFLMCHTDLAPKRKFNILTRVINDISNKYDSADVKKKLETKSRLQKEFEENQEFNVSDIGDKIFGDNTEKKEAFDAKMERYDMQYDNFSVVKESTVKKLEKQIIVTDTGIEISIPMEEYNTKENVVITKEPDGTATITIKNIEGVVVK
ncbi:MAG: nucleoid-associated protein [Lachnospiraceae bacterium]|nr:nucleoid-associated protein [Lachnospiraceae bacterium]